LREKIQDKHYSLQTEDAYTYWVRQFILFHKAKSGAFRHPDELGMSEVYQFLTNLAVDRKVAASTQNQALSAIVFLCKHILQTPLGDEQITAVRARKPKRPPTVLSKPETMEVINCTTNRINS
jgi:site-specific recombinase XerD